MYDISEDVPVACSFVTEFFQVKIGLVAISVIAFVFRRYEAAIFAKSKEEDKELKPKAFNIFGQSFKLSFIRQLVYRILPVAGFIYLIYEMGQLKQFTNQMTNSDIYNQETKAFLILADTCKAKDDEINPLLQGKETLDWYLSPTTKTFDTTQ